MSNALFCTFRSDLQVVWTYSLIWWHRRLVLTDLESTSVSCLDLKV